MQGFHLFLVVEQRYTQGNLLRIHTPKPFNLLKELKAACAQYGPMAPFTQIILESMSLEALPTGDWKQWAKACLSGGHYLLWKIEFVQQCQATAERKKGQQVLISYKCL